MSKPAAFDDSSPPDWDALGAIGSEVEQLVESGAWTKVEFDRLYAEGKKVVNGQLEFLEGLLMSADPAWLD